MDARMRMRFAAATLFIFSQAAAAQMTGAATHSEPIAPAGPTPTRVLAGGFNGSVVSQTVSPVPLALTMRDAIALGLKNNLGLLLTQQGQRGTQGARLQALAALLPSADGRLTETVQKINLAAFGFHPANGSDVVGPFSVFDARAAVTIPVFNWSNINRLRSANEQNRAALLSYADSRELVVLVVANLYLRALADAARVDAAKADFDTAKDVLRQTADLKSAGMVAGIDLLRAEVQARAREQRLVAATNEFEKDKIDLARAIGIPLAQQLALADSMPFVPIPEISLEMEIAKALATRADYKEAEALVRAAERDRSAARAQYLPKLEFSGDYGALGKTPASSVATYTAAGALQVPLFQGGRIRGEVQQADAILQQRKAQVADMGSSIEEEVRKAVLDLRANDQQVLVAKSGLDLARQQLQQARDRFSAGVGTSLDVSQAEEAVAAANESYIASLYGDNIAKASLARAVGTAEESIKSFLGSK